MNLVFEVVPSTVSVLWLNHKQGRQCRNESAQKSNRSSCSIWSAHHRLLIVRTWPLFFFRGFSNEWQEFIIRHFHWILLTQYSREKKGGRKSKITKFFSTDVARLVVYFQLFFPSETHFRYFNSQNAILCQTFFKFISSFVSF